MTGHNLKKRKLFTLLSTTVFLILSLVLFCVLSSGEGKIKIYFYSSEANINNFKSLKMEFDRYLEKLGPYELQPFSARDVFEKQIKGKKNCLLLLSSWHYRHIHKEYGLIPALSGLRNGQKYQKKLLVADENAPDIKTGKPGLIASASSLEYTSTTVHQMLQEKFPPHDFKILTVPKDVDALMSVGFGMAKLAFASENAIEELKGVNPRLCGKMKVLATGEETLRMILAVPRTFMGESRNKSIDVLRNMPVDSEGKSKIRMLGLDGWEDLNASDLSKLES